MGSTPTSGTIVARACGLSWLGAQAREPGNCVRSVLVLGTAAIAARGSAPCGRDALADQRKPRRGRHSTKGLGYPQEVRAGGASREARAPHRAAPPAASPDGYCLGLQLIIPERVTFRVLRSNQTSSSNPVPKSLSQRAASGQSEPLSPRSSR